MTKEPQGQTLEGRARDCRDRVGTPFFCFFDPDDEYHICLLSETKLDYEDPNIVDKAMMFRGLQLDCPNLNTVFVRPSSRGPTVQMAGRVFRKHLDTTIVNVGSSTEMVNSPSRLVTVPLVVPLINILAPGRGLPFSSVTVPVIVRGCSKLAAPSGVMMTSLFDVISYFNPASDIEFAISVVADVFSPLAVISLSLIVSFRYTKR